MMCCSDILAICLFLFFPFQWRFSSNLFRLPACVRRRHMSLSSSPRRLPVFLVSRLQSPASTSFHAAPDSLFSSQHKLYIVLLQSVASLQSYSNELWSSVSSASPHVLTLRLLSENKLFCIDAIRLFRFRKCHVWHLRFQKTSCLHY